MIFLYIFIGLIALLLLASFIPIRIYFSMEYDLSLKIRFLFLNLRILPSETNQEDSNEETKKGSKKIIGKGGLFDSINELFKLLKILFSKVLWIIKKTKIHKLKGIITVATEDAAKTGLEYGAICSLVYPALGFLGTLTDISPAEVEVKADFDSSDASISLDAECSLKLGFAVVAAFSVFWQYFKIKFANNEDKIQKERKN